MSGRVKSPGAVTRGMDSPSAAIAVAASGRAVWMGSGDAVDVAGGTTVTGSWRPDNPLQLWDFGSGALIENISWGHGLNDEPCFLYAAQFSKEGNGELIAAGGSGSNEAKVFDRASGKAIGTVSGMTKGVYTVDFSPDSSMLAVAGGDASVRLLEIKKVDPADAAMD